MGIYQFLCNCWLRDSQSNMDEMFESCLFLRDEQEIREVLSSYHHSPSTIGKLQRPSDQSNLLLVASVAGDAPLVELLLQEGSQVVDDHDGNSPLLVACLGGHTAVVDALLDAGNDWVTRSNHQGTTPLMAAAWRGHLAIVKKLAQMPGVSLTTTDSLNRTAKDLAKEWGHPPVVEFLEANMTESLSKTLGTYQQTMG